MVKRKRGDHGPVDNKEAKYGQFQTNTNIAQACVDEAEQFMPANAFYIEPSAGYGAFYDLLPADRRVGVEIDEALRLTRPEYIFADFLKVTPQQLGIEGLDRRQIVVRGNPPFTANGSNKRNAQGSVAGGKSNLALEMVNAGAKIGDTVDFILGCNFRKKSIQDRIDPELHLIYDRVMDIAWQRKNGACFSLRDQNKMVGTLNVTHQIWQRKYDQNGVPILRAMQKNTRISKDRAANKWLVDGIPIDFDVLPTNDARANVLVRKWASKDRVGDILNLLTDQAIMEEMKANKRSTSGNTWFYLKADDAAKTTAQFKNNKSYITESARGTATCTAITLNVRDLIDMYIH